MNPTADNPQGLTFTQKILIGLVAGAVIGVVGVLVQHHVGGAFARKNGAAGKRIKV